MAREDVESEITSQDDESPGRPLRVIRRVSVRFSQLRVVFTLIPSVTKQTCMTVSLVGFTHFSVGDQPRSERPLHMKLQPVSLCREKTEAPLSLLLLF